jgi:hypothetical protein
MKTTLLTLSCVLATLLCGVLATHAVAADASPAGTIHIRRADSRKAFAPYPPSTLIEGISLGDRIIDGVTSGDQWAPTWADDGHLYSGWGDGTGFGYRGGWNDRWTTYLGVPRVEGNPPNLIKLSLQCSDQH